MKILLINLMLMTALSSCLNRQGQERPEIEDQEQLSPSFAKEVIIDGKYYIPVEGSICFSRVYRIDKTMVGSVGQVHDLDIRECNKIIGRAPQEYGVFVTFLENFRVWLINFL